MQFLAGTTVKECYEACAVVANKWLDILTKKGQGVDTDLLIELISESKNLSKGLEEYGKQKGVGITAAKRMG